LHGRSHRSKSGLLQGMSWSQRIFAALLSAGHSPTLISIGRRARRACAGEREVTLARATSEGSTSRGPASGVGPTILGPRRRGALSDRFDTCRGGRDVVGVSLSHLGTRGGEGPPVVRFAGPTGEAFSARTAWSEWFDVNEKEI
jgi:hypothetical protein